MTARKVFILGATFATGNMGVGALTAGTVRAIRHAWPDAEIHLLDYGKDPVVFQCLVEDRTVGVPLVNLRFSKNIFLKNHIVFLILLAGLARFLPGKQGEWILGGNAWLRSIRSADLVGSIAGGDSFSDIYGVERLLYVTLPQILVILLGKTLVQLPQTYGPYKGRFARALARWILRRSDRVYSRDYQGIEELKGLLGQRLVSERAHFSYDVGFALEPMKPATLDLAGLNVDCERDASLLVGLNVSGLLYMGGYTRGNMFGLHLDYPSFTDAMIEYLIVRKKAKVLLVPHVFGTSEHSESDSSVCEAVYERYRDRYPGKVFLARGTYDQGEIKWIIGCCDLFIGARMHACIAALSQCIPTVSIAYSRKFFGVMETIGIESFVADVRTVDAEGVLRLVNDLFERRAEIRCQLEQRMPEVREQALRLFDGIDAGEAAVKKKSA